MKRLVVAALAAVLAAGGAAAQERSSRTSLAAGLTLTSGDSETGTLNASLRSEGARGALEWRTVAEGNYAEARTETTVDGRKREATDTTAQNAKGSVALKLRRGAAYLYTDDSVFHDRVAGIDYRLIAGVGAGRYLIEGNRARLSAEAGAAYLSEALADDADADYVAYRLAARHEQRLSETARFWETVEYLPRADATDDYLVNAEIGAEAALNSHLSIRLVAQDRYDSTPPGGAEKNNLTAIAAVAVTL
jgi:putative salt-induced outer membrane protein